VKRHLLAWINGDPQVDENDDIYQKTQSTTNGNTSEAIGTGLANSNAIVAQVEEAGGTDIPYAAALCLDYSVGAGDYLLTTGFCLPGTNWPSYSPTAT
jgi:hypothetical protein